MMTLIGGNSSSRKKFVDQALSPTISVATTFVHGFTPQRYVTWDRARSREIPQNGTLTLTSFSGPNPR
jgi:hypothetical protein